MMDYQMKITNRNERCVVFKLPEGSWELLKNYLISRKVDGISTDFCLSDTVGYAELWESQIPTRLNDISTTEKAINSVIEHVQKNMAELKRHNEAWKIQNANLLKKIGQLEVEVTGLRERLLDLAEKSDHLITSEDYNRLLDRIIKIEEAKKKKAEA